MLKVYFNKKSQNLQGILDIVKQEIGAVGVKWMPTGFMIRLFDKEDKPLPVAKGLIFIPNRNENEED